jgi:molecular chaperone HtpG
VEQIVPEFLTLLQGVIDSPDIPLNVSRSYLQGDPNVKKISQHIVKKVGDKLFEIFRNNREDFQQKWESLSVFVKYGMLSDDKFYDTANKFCLYQTTAGGQYTFEELKEKISPLQTDKNKNLVVLYTTDKDAQDSYIQNAQKYNYEVLIMDAVIDNHFINSLEQKLSDTSFKRVDADTLNKLIEKEETLESVLSKDEEEKLKAIFTETIDNKSASIELKALSPDDLPVQITKNEFMRRMAEMSKMGGSQYGFMGEMPENYALVVNTNHPIASKILQDANGKETVKKLYDLALLSQGMLKGKALTDFIQRTYAGI